MFEKLEGSDSMQHIRPVGLSSTGLGKEGFVEGTGSFHWKWHQLCELCVAAFGSQWQPKIANSCTKKATSLSRIGTEILLTFNKTIRTIYSVLRGYTKHRFACKSVPNPDCYQIMRSQIWSQSITSCSQESSARVYQCEILPNKFTKC